MRNPQNMLSSLQQHSHDKSYVFERLYRNLYNRDLFLLAYQNIYAHEGNMTRGADGKTIDAMSIARIDSLIQSLQSEKYQPQPSRRTYIPKKNGQKRPLGIPSFDDKLVQEVLRMMLEAIYEGYFENSSHGFRPKRSCHTALQQIQIRFTGVKWFIEGDIKGFFDNINHNILMGILAKRIADERLLRLIRKFLKAGYLENWQFHKTYSGTPQGGIISPLLANIYLDQLDKYMEEYKIRFDCGAGRKKHPMGYHLGIQHSVLVNQYKRASSDEERLVISKKLREVEKTRLQYPNTDPMDDSFKRLQYVRYADDFLIGVIGSKQDALAIKADIKDFLQEKLHLELSEEKTLVTHAGKAARFLGFDIYVRNTQATKRNKLGHLRRFLNGTVALIAPTEVVRKRLLDYGAIELKTVDGKEIWKSRARYFLKDNDDLEILEQYNREIRGFRNYYSIANNSGWLSHFGYHMEYSMYKTYATKYRTSKHNIIEKYRIGKDFGVNYTTSKGKIRTRLFYNEGFRRLPFSNTPEVDTIPNTVRYSSKTSLIDRLKAGKCELCGAVTDNIEIHHVRKLKGLQGKSYWEKLMIARRRKTLALCVDCHGKLHAGKLN